MILFFIEFMRQYLFAFAFSGAFQTRCTQLCFNTLVCHHFSIDQFAEIYGKKLGMNTDGLRKTLWGDFYLNSKTKRIMKGAQVRWGSTERKRQY